MPFPKFNKDLEAEIAALKDQVASLTLDLDTAQTVANDADESLKKICGELDDEKAKTKKLTADVEAATERADKAEAELALAKEKSDHFDDEVEAAAQRLLASSGHTPPADDEGAAGDASPANILEAFDKVKDNPVAKVQFIRENRAALRAARKAAAQPTE